MREWVGVEREDNGEGENCRVRCPRLVRVVNRSRSLKAPLNVFMADKGLPVFIWSEDRAPRKFPSMTFLLLAQVVHDPVYQTDI